MPSVRAVHAVGRHGRLAATVAVLGLLAGCTADPAEPDAPAERPSISDAHLDLSDLAVPRADICDLLPEEDVEQALGGPVSHTAHYGNGDEVEVTPGVRDVSHEYGCVFEAGDGTVARTWVFARPVASAEARELVRRPPGCAFPDVLTFGRPSLASVCEVAAAEPGRSTRVRARLEGLFTDTWLACEISEPPGPAGAAPPSKDAEVMQRAAQWCTEVVTTAGAT